jgi:hypothetical protein
MNCGLLCESVRPSWGESRLAQSRHLWGLVHFISLLYYTRPYAYDCLIPGLRIGLRSFTKATQVTSIRVYNAWGSMQDPQWA